MKDYRLINACDTDIKTYLIEGDCYLSIDNIISSLGLNQNKEISYLKSLPKVYYIKDNYYIALKSLNHWLGSINSNALNDDAKYRLKECRDDLKTIIVHELGISHQINLNHVIVPRSVSIRYIQGSSYLSAMDICEHYRVDKIKSINKLINDEEFKGFLHYSIDGLFISELVSDYFIGKLIGIADNNYKEVA